ncbi:hypothetical protein K469DRAFT_645070 [Zopfia rhizophila CBS 207.26]|uniref:Uncharacterized protein n=1 Tax=Zopfia rhizophila CBS 207.26 TaxID=1314779 RepID=A0A6A6DBU8_9PEZI|nr:hypothetical protein K469DRAFT_645070 [Zopfia rhizophila CBS 207.26]
MLSKAGTFDNCMAIYGNDTTLQAKYYWSGPTPGIPASNTSHFTHITREGCLAVCGDGSDYYPWAISSATITTWLLPLIGMLLQAPFESNAFRRTVLAIARWVGNPIASISYILWNIRVSGKCALIVDMALPYEDTIPSKNSDWASMRDSFYILVAMNQYTMKPKAALQKEAEGLLRIVLFGKDLRLLKKERTLREMRRKVAQHLRAGRKRGIVPVYISTLWFIFALALSIQSAFGHIGENSTAHDLALGLLLSWLPVLILCSIVDRNPVASEDCRRRLNKLVDVVRRSLHDDRIRTEFIESFQNQPEAKLMECRVTNISLQSRYMDEFFVSFAGQGRVRWHYGCAHPIISDIENAYVADHGRNWLYNEREARTHLVLGPAGDDGLLWFDPRELWQITSAIAIVLSTIGGAFVLSYYTPTVGLGCRSGGYMIFGVISFSLLVFEMLVWWLSSNPTSVQPPNWVRRQTMHLQRYPIVIQFEEGICRGLKIAYFGVRTVVEDLFVKGLFTCLSLLPFTEKQQKLQSAEHIVRTCLDAFHDFTFQQKTELLLFRPLEILNVIWLIYIVLAQTFGYYRTCDCVTSSWGVHSGGYLDFTQSDVTNSPWVVYYWTSGTVLSVSVMGLAMIYVVTEWCLQSHISTENYESARRGLRRTRRFRRLTLRIRNTIHYIMAVFVAVLDWIYDLFGMQYRPLKSLRWTPDITFLYDMTPEANHHPSGSVDITPSSSNTPNQLFEIQDHDAFHSRASTPRFHNHFSPLTTSGQFPLLPRDSDASSRPLIAQPCAPHSPGHSRASSDAGRSRTSLYSDTIAYDFGSPLIGSPPRSPHGSAGSVTMERSTSEGSEYLSPITRRTTYPRQGSDAASQGRPSTMDLGIRGLGEERR